MEPQLLSISPTDLAGLAGRFSERKEYGVGACVSRSRSATRSGEPGHSAAGTRLVPEIDRGGLAGADARSARLGAGFRNVGGGFGGVYSLCAAVCLTRSPNHGAASWAVAHHGRLCRGIRRPAPRKIEPKETFSPAFLMEDATALLIACAANALALRADDRQLYAKTARAIGASLNPLPGWVDGAIDFDPEIRVNTIASYVRTSGLAEDRGDLRVTDLGRQWLGLPAGDRLRVLVDGILDRKQSVELFKDFAGAQIGAVAPRVQVSAMVKPLPDFEVATMRPFRELEGDDFYPLEQILAYCRPETNPLLAVHRRDKFASFTVVCCIRAGPMRPLFIKCGPKWFADSCAPACCPSGPCAWAEASKESRSV